MLGPKTMIRCFITLSPTKNQAVSCLIPDVLLFGLTVLGIEIPFVFWMFPVCVALVGPVEPYC